MSRGILFLAVVAALVAVAFSQAVPSPEAEGPFSAIRNAIERATENERDTLEQLLENFRNATEGLRNFYSNLLGEAASPTISV